MNCFRELLIIGSIALLVNIALASVLEVDTTPGLFFSISFALQITILNVGLFIGYSKGTHHYVKIARKVDENMKLKDFLKSIDSYESKFKKENKRKS